MAVRNPRTEGFFSPKTQLARMINALPFTTDDTTTGLIGKFGERGVMFSTHKTDDGDAPVGFWMVGKDITPKHTNIDRDQAVALVNLLANAFGMDVAMTDAPPIAKRWTVGYTAHGESASVTVEADDLHAALDVAEQDIDYITNYATFTIDSVSPIAAINPRQAIVAS